ncbi:MAG: adenosylcobinamide-GDP ribazoletransferase [Gammaproteobacteria bacterium]|nr:adenosylcobinamide-GDP ribazoletransferase [Gammaproteobacteria bacterium]
MPLLIALQFLTRLPIHLPRAPSPAEQGRSLLHYPLVGLLLGGLLASLAWLFSAVPPALLAALLLALWVLASGALHLDGLADTVDAWVGGYGDRERTLAIMKDPACGPMGVTALVLVLLLKWAALYGLLQQDLYWALLLAPWLGRSCLPILLLCLPYVRANGLGATMAANLPRKSLFAILLVHGLLMLALGWSGLLAMAIAAVTCSWAGWHFLRRLGGTTGDTAGATVELVECAVLVGLAVYFTVGLDRVSQPLVIC